MNKIIIFTIICEKEFDIPKSESALFRLIYEDGECVDGNSFNPFKGWVRYESFMDNWSEMDDGLNELLLAIKEYSLSDELKEFIGVVDKDDVGKIHHTSYFCSDYVPVTETYYFDVIIREVF